MNKLKRHSELGVIRMSKFDIDDTFALADELDNQREWADTPKRILPQVRTYIYPVHWAV